MNVLAASSLELGTHPATALLLGGLIAAVIRGRYASMTLVIAPILGFWYVSTLEVGSVSYLSLFGYEILGVAVDQQAKLFGYLFHIAALVAGIYSFPYGILGKYRWHCFMPPVRWGLLLPEICYPYFSGGKDWQSLQSFKFGVEKRKKRKTRVSGIYFFMYPPVCSFWQVF